MASAHAFASTFRGTLMAVALCALAAPAMAQPAPAPAGGPAAAPPPAAPSEDLPPPPPPPSYAEPTADGSCTPACRSGFTCQGGQCVSACNPACGAGEQCTPQGECVMMESGGAPSFPVPEDMGPPPAREGVEQHDGFMLRLALGFGGGGAGLDPEGPGGEIDFSGAGGGFSLDIGGAPVDNLIIHVRLSDFVMVEPKAEIAGFEGELNGSLGSNMLGIGLTYYFMPINLYLTAALGAGWLTVDLDNDNDDTRGTDAGVGFNFDVGKEWWVSDNWGLGLAGRFAMVSGSTTDDDTDVETAFALAAFTLMFSATYN